MTKKIDKRLDDLENAAGGERPWMAVFQDHDDPNIFHETSARNDDKTWTVEELKELNKTYDLFKVVYVDDWRGVAPPILDNDELQGNPIQA